MLVNPPSVAAGCDVRPVRSKSEMGQFQQLPRRLYAGDSFNVLPLRMLQDQVLDRKRHPFYDQGRGASAEYFLAVDRATGRCVGRIAAILDNRHNQHARQQDPGHELCGHFGFFDCENSQPVARELIVAAADWLRARGVRRMLGPASPSQSYDYGLLIEGHDQPHRFLLPYHPAYYAALLEGCGLTKAKDLISLSADLHDPVTRRKLEEYVRRTDAMRARSTSNITIRPVDMRHYREEARAFGGVMNEVLRDHFGHSPVTEQEWQLITGSLRPFATADFILLAEQNGKPIGLAIAVPDLNEIIRRLRLRIGLLEPLEFLLRAWRSRPACVCIVVVGVIHGGGHFGAALMLVGQLARNLLAHHVRFIDAHQVLEDNHRILTPLLRHGLQPDRRYRVYQMAL